MLIELQIKKQAGSSSYTSIYESKNQSEKSNYQIIEKKRCSQSNEQQKEVKKYETSKYWLTIWL